MAGPMWTRYFVSKLKEQFYKTIRDFYKTF